VRVSSLFFRVVLFFLLLLPARLPLLVRQGSAQPVIVGLRE
jgi:hypothetical protein